MDNRPLGIVVAAVGISKEVLGRFVDTLYRTTPLTAFKLYVVTEASVPTPPGTSAFRVSFWRNDGILKALGSCHQIVCVDVDSLVPSGLVEYTRHKTSPGTAVWAQTRNLPLENVSDWDWEKWVWRPARVGASGSWVAMHASDWMKVGGWDERLTGHGAEDDIMALRREQLGIRTIASRQFPLMHVNHPDRDLRVAGGNLDNLRIGTEPPPKNYLTARLPVLDHYNNHFNFLVTSHCTRDCPECSQRGFRKWASAGYSLSLSRIEEWIQCTKASGYPPYRSLILTGGEALSWDHVEEGARLLRESGTGELVNLFTNGDLVERATDKLMESLSVLRVSHYGNNASAIARLQKRYGAKVDVAHRQRHYPIPKVLGATEEVLPAKCACEGPGLVGGQVYGCSMLPTVAEEFGLDLSEYPESHCQLQVGYLEMLAGFPRTRHDCCRGCIGNYAFRQQTVSANG